LRPNLKPYVDNKAPNLATRNQPHRYRRREEGEFESIWKNLKFENRQTWKWRPFFRDHTNPMRKKGNTLILWKKGEIFGDFFWENTLHIWKYFALHIRTDSFCPPSYFAAMFYGYDQPISELNVGNKVAVRDCRKSSGDVRWQYMLFCRVWENICTKLKYRQTSYLSNDTQWCWM